jgi:hypothetical protein
MVCLEEEESGIRPGGGCGILVIGTWEVVREMEEVRYSRLVVSRKSSLRSLSGRSQSSVNELHLAHTSTHHM